MPSTSDEVGGCFFDAGLFIAALLKGDSRHAEARPVVESARRGEIPACTSAGVLSEVYAALTWEKASPRHDPVEAARVIRLLVQPPSAIEVLTSDRHVALRMLELAAAHGLTARRVHDARHAAVALLNGVRSVYTYDASDWQAFESDGLTITGPPSVLHHLGGTP